MTFDASQVKQLRKLQQLPLLKGLFTQVTKTGYTKIRIARFLHEKVLPNRSNVSLISVNATINKQSLSGVLQKKSEKFSKIYRKAPKVAGVRFSVNFAIFIE